MDSIELAACFFFFKQKTAYELSSRDWSSDVCSSDLDGPKPMSAVAARDGEGRVRVHEGVVLHPPGREVPAVVEGPGEAEGRGGDLGLVPRVRDPVVPFSDEREHVVEESACVDVADGDQLRLRGESEGGAGLVLRNDRRRTERPVVPAARRERVADLERDE